MSFTSAIAIANMALGHLGRTTTPIASFTEKSTEARVCTTWYDPCRREVLETFNWSFARKRRLLPLHADAPPTEWQFRYQTPSDLIAVRGFWNPAYPPVYAPPYDLESSDDGQSLTLVTNMEAPTMIYTFDATLESLFSPLFVNALAHCMAAKMALGLTGKQSMEDKEAKAFQSALSYARASNANQSIAAAPRDADAVLARL